MDKSKGEPVVKVGSRDNSRSRSQTSNRSRDTKRKEDNKDTLSFAKIQVITLRLERLDYFSDRKI